MGILVRVVDWVLLLFCLSHLAAIVIFDGQVLFPQLYPQSVKDFAKKTAEEMQDPFSMPNKAPWYLVLTALEVFFKVPILLLAIPAFLVQSARLNYMRIPLIMLAVETITTMLMMTAETIMVDYSKLPYGPKTPEKVNGILAIYIPFMAVALVMLLRAWMTPRMWYGKVKSA